MPGSDGVEATAAIRSEFPARRYRPSSVGRKGPRIRARQLGTHCLPRRENHHSYPSSKNNGGWQRGRTMLALRTNQFCRFAGPPTFGASPGIPSHPQAINYCRQPIANCIAHTAFPDACLVFWRTQDISATVPRVVSIRRAVEAQPNGGGWTYLGPETPHRGDPSGPTYA